MTAETRKKMLERVRAIMAKTLDNGCTEAEAMTALEKAQELMAAYDISEADLGVTTETEAATIHKEMVEDPYRIKKQLGGTVGRFCRCKSWTSSQYPVGFAGLESDLEFAKWLLDTLSKFVLRELKNHQALRRSQGLKCPRIVSSSFVMGCVNRIAERLKQLTPVAPAAATGNALTISRNALIADAMKKNGIVLGKGRSTPRRADMASYYAGQAAGNSARFDRPVGSGGGVLRLK
jgi:hypothetical protein